MRTNLVLKEDFRSKLSSNDEERLDKEIQAVLDTYERYIKSKVSKWWRTLSNFSLQSLSPISSNLKMKATFFLTLALIATAVSAGRITQVQQGGASGSDKSAKGGLVCITAIVDTCCSYLHG